MLCITLWMAICSKSGLKYEFLKPIKDYRIIVFPDKGEYSDWFHMAKKLNKLRFKISLTIGLKILITKQEQILPICTYKNTKNNQAVKQIRI